MCCGACSHLDACPPGCCSEGHCPYPALPTAKPIAALGACRQGASIAALSSFAGTLLRNTHTLITEYMGKANEPQAVLLLLVLACYLNRFLTRLLGTWRQKKACTVGHEAAASYAI